MGVRLLGTTVDSIKKSEDRELFKQTMEKIGEPCIDSVITHTVEAAVDFAAKNGYPVIVRPAYTLEVRRRNCRRRKRLKGNLRPRASGVARSSVLDRKVRFRLEGNRV